MSQISKDEFVVRYCDRSGLGKEHLFDLGLVAIPCDCTYEQCLGWQMVTKETLKRMAEDGDVHGFDLYADRPR